MKFSRKGFVWKCSILAIFPLAFGDTAWATVRIVDYNLDLDNSSATRTGDGLSALGANGLPPGLDTVLKAIGDEALNGNSQPIDVLALQELQASSSPTTTLSPSLAAIVSELNAIYQNAGIPNVTYAYDTFNDQTTGGYTTGGGPSGVIYRVQTMQEIGTTVGLAISGSGASRAPERLLLRPVGYSSSPSVSTPADFYLYNSHYKADSGSANAARRAVEAAEIRTNSNALPANSHIIYTGDFNLTSGSSEAAYTDLTAAGNGQAWDPKAGWTNGWSGLSVANKALMSESATDLNVRFDFQLDSNAVNPANNMAGLQLIPASYNTFGNNGSTSDVGSGSTALADLSNRATVLSDLTTVTDHLPTVADYDFIFSDTWKTSASGNWNTAANWLGTTVPSGPSSTATLAVVGGSGTLTVHLDQSHAIGSLVFGNTAGTAAEGWLIDNNGSTANSLTFSGSTASSITVNALATGNAVTISAALLGTAGLAKKGVGTLVLSGSNTYAGGTTVSGGSLVFSSTAALPATGKLTINKDATTGQGTTVVVGAGASNINAYRSALAASFPNGAWTNAGAIGSTDAAANPGQGIGYMVGSAYNTLYGTTFGATDVILNYTYMGDANLDGVITVSDYASIDAGFLLGGFSGGNPASWINGDFNYDGVINYEDYALIDFAYLNQSGGALADSEIAIHASEFGAPYENYLAALESAAATSPVPEPATLTLLTAGILLALRKRKISRT